MHALSYSTYCEIPGVAQLTTLFAHGFADLRSLWMQTLHRHCYHKASNRASSIKCVCLWLLGGGYVCVARGALNRCRVAAASFIKLLSNRSLLTQLSIDSEDSECRVDPVPLVAGEAAPAAAHTPPTVDDSKMYSYEVSSMHAKSCMLLGSYCLHMELA